MAFDGTEGGSVDLGDAGEWTAAYRSENPNGTQGHFFGIEILSQILEQSGCMGIRIYYAMKNGKQQLILVGADEEEGDQVGEGHTVADLSVTCPPTCGSNNDLNG